MASSSRTRNFLSIGVFASPHPGQDPSFIAAANRLGNLLAGKHIGVVYSGGTSGLRGHTAATVLLKGVRVLAVTLKFIAGVLNTAYSFGDELKVTRNQDRVFDMMVNSEAFIVLPGGFGTMEELFSVLSWAQKGVHFKPIGLLNIGGFFDSLLTFVDSMVEQGFISPVARRILLCANTPEELLEKLMAFVPMPDPFVPMLRDQRHGCNLDLNL